jgi:hypothetical protein
MPDYFVAAALPFSPISSRDTFNRGEFASVKRIVVEVRNGATGKATAVDIAIVATNHSNKA